MEEEEPEVEVDYIHLKIFHAEGMSRRNNVWIPLITVKILSIILQIILRRIILIYIYFR